MFGERLPSNGRTILLEVPVLELLIGSDGSAALPDVAVSVCERERFVCVPFTEGLQAATDVYHLCGKRQGEVRGIYEDVPFSFVSTATVNVTTVGSSPALVPQTGGTTSPSARAIGPSFAVYPSTEPCE